jgi:hypothetical protein
MHGWYFDIAVNLPCFSNDHLPIIESIIFAISSGVFMPGLKILSFFGFRTLSL